MAYRDEKEALEVRVAELEEELDAAHATIARLRGEGASPAVDDEVDALSGVPKMLSLERELPFEVTDAGLVAIADLLNARIPGGNVAQVGDTLTHRKGTYELRLATTEGGASRLRATGDYRGVRTQLMLGSPGLGLIGSVLVAGLFAGLRMGRAGVVIGAVLGFVAAVYLLRVRIQTAMSKDRQNIAATFEAVADLAERHKKTRTRIATGSAHTTREDEALEVEESESRREAL